MDFTAVFHPYKWSFNGVITKNCTSLIWAILLQVLNLSVSAILWQESPHVSLPFLEFFPFPGGDFGRDRLPR